MGNETFTHWMQLLSSLWAGVCDYDQFWSLAGRVAQSAEAMPNFSFCYVTSRKNQLFCAPILYRYIIIKLYNNTTIFSRLLPICVCFRGSAPDTARGLTASLSPMTCLSMASFFPWFNSRHRDANHALTPIVTRVCPVTKLHHKASLQSACSCNCTS